MEWTSKDIAQGSDELQAVAAIILGGYLPGGIPIQKEGKKDE